VSALQAAYQASRRRRFLGQPEVFLSQPTGWSPWATKVRGSG